MPPQPDTTLVVMNMQEVHTRCLFRPKQPILLNAVMRELNSAMLDDTPIIVVDHPDFSVNPPRDENADDPNKTHRCIADALEHYDYTFSLCNESNDASEQIMKICGTLGYPIKRIQLCGLFTNHAIRDTAVGLARRMPTSTIEVLREACASTNPHDETYDSFWDRFCEPNIEIIPAPVTLPVSVTNRPLYFVEPARDHMNRLYDEPISL